jgi:hypothetical protein
MPDPVYPIVSFPDGTLVKDPAAADVFIVFGGAKFWIPSPAAATALGINLGATLGIDPAELARLPSAPVDFTLLRELNRPEVYVVYGRAKFWITSPARLRSLGFNFGQVHIVPDGALANIPIMPQEGTLLKEQNDPKVYLVKNSTLCWVTTATVFDNLCLSFRNVRSVPDGALTTLPKGPDVT